MNRIKQFKSRHPIVFSFISTLALILTVIAIAIVANRWPAESPGWYIAAMGGGVVAILLAVSTVKKHVGNILVKLDGPNRIQAIARARELALLS